MRRVLALVLVPLLAAPLLLPAAPPAPAERTSAVTTPTYNLDQYELPAAIAAVPGESPTITRVGVVSEIVESDNITVKISGSPVLVRASYLFPQYEPVVGDVVIVQKQDAQWLVLGTMSGPVNTLALNPSFEEGTVGGAPSSWTLTNTLTTAGSPTFTKQLVYRPLSGKYVGQLSLLPTALDLSVSEVVSSRLQTVPGEVWTGAAFVQMASLAGPDRVSLALRLRWYDNGASVISEDMLSAGQEFSAAQTWALVRPDSTLTVATAPGGAASVALVVEATFNVQNASTVEIIVEFDNMMLRRVS